MPVRNEFRFRSELSPTTVTPRLTPLGFGGVPFRLLLLHSLACFLGFYSLARALRFSQNVSARASSVLSYRPRPYFFRAQPRFFPEPDASANCPANQTTAHRQARLNSRNLLIIASDLHIVNHSTLHLRERQVTGLQVTGHGCQVMGFDLSFVSGATVRVDTRKANVD
jgi:hypothetical protein